jgi:hypothetical protein
MSRLVAVVLALALSGCGYALVGRGVTTDASIKKIGVPLFRDRTGQAGLDQRITQKVIEELLKRNRFDVAQQTEGVDARVDGEILTYRVAPVGFSDDPLAADPTTARTQASRYAVTVTARVVYSKAGDKEPIWSSESFSFRDEYDITGDPATFFNREDQALERLTEQFARSLVAAMLEAF